MRPANILTIALTLLVALIFQLYPWYGQGVILRPDFLLVTTLYWVLRAPNVCNVGIAWFAGLIIDLSAGGLLGQHALSFTLTAFFALQYQRRIVLFNQTQLSVYMLALLILERLIILLLKLFSSQENPGWSHMLPVVTSLILWQFLVAYFGAPTRPRKR